MPDGPWSLEWRMQAYAHARRLYIETGDLDAFTNMLRWVTLEGNYWEILGDDPNICNPAWNVDIITERTNERIAYQRLSRDAS